MQLRNVIFQCSIAQNFKANGTNDKCNSLKRKQKSFEMYNTNKYLTLRNLVVTKPRNKRLMLKQLYIIAHWVVTCVYRD